MDSTNTTLVWKYIATGSTQYADDHYRLHDSFKWLEPEPEFNPQLHQKRPRQRIKQTPFTSKGVGYFDQFRGYRYPVGKKK